MKVWLTFKRSKWNVVRSNYVDIVLCFVAPGGTVVSCTLCLKKMSQLTRTGNKIETMIHNRVFSQLKLGPISQNNSKRNHLILKYYLKYKDEYKTINFSCDVYQLFCFIYCDWRSGAIWLRRLCKLWFCSN